MRVLVTGFDPFGGEPVNPALEAVRRLPKQAGSLEIETRELPTVFGRALEVLEREIAALEPEIVLCIGQAGGRAELSIERVGINVDDARIPDNDGKQPIDLPIVEGGPNAYFSNLPIKAMTQALIEAGIPAKVSNTAGTFVCNHVLYGLMHLIATRFPRARGGFVHIPFLPSQAARHPGEPSMAAETVIEGITIALQAAAERREDIAAAFGTTH